MEHRLKVRADGSGDSVNSDFFVAGKLELDVMRFDIEENRNPQGPFTHRERRDGSSTADGMDGEGWGHRARCTDE